MYLTEIVTHSQSRIHPKNFSSKCQLFPQADFVHIIFKTTCHERLFLSAETGVRDPGAPSCRAQPRGPRTAPGRPTSSVSARALASADQTRFPSQGFAAGPSSSPLKKGFSFRRKGSLTGFLLVDPRVRGRVILMSIWLCSLCLHLAPPCPLRQRPVTLCHKRGGDLSMW